MNELKIDALLWKGLKPIALADNDCCDSLTSPILFISSTPRSCFFAVPTSAVDDQQHQIGPYCPNLGLSRISTYYAYFQRSELCLLPAPSVSLEQIAALCRISTLPGNAVRRKRGEAGLNDMTIEAFSSDVDTHMQRLHETLVAHARPTALRHICPYQAGWRPAPHRHSHCGRPGRPACHSPGAGALL